MPPTTTITNWLNRPAIITESEREDITALLVKYPYLIPLRQLDCILQTKHSNAPITALWNRIPIYIGNRICFWELQQKIEALQPDQKAFNSNPIAQALNTTTTMQLEDELIFEPAFTTDYFFHQGIKLEEDEPEKEQKTDQALMIMRNFSDWLIYFRNKKAAEKQEEEEKKALKSMWQKEKLAAALESESDNIPETVLQMAVNSITKEEGLISESLAEILLKQEKYDQAIEMYRKLSLRNPQKNTYFARKVEAILKVKQS